MLAPPPPPPSKKILNFFSQVESKYNHLKPKKFKEKKFLYKKTESHVRQEHSVDSR